MGKFIAAAAVMHLNLGRLEEEFRRLAEAGYDELHFDVADGDFASPITLGHEFVALAKSCVQMHRHVHLLTARPERHIRRFVDAGAESVTLHAEACAHPYRALAQIRDMGASPGIALNPATPLTKLNYLLPLVDRVLLSASESGFSSPKMMEIAFERCKILHENIRYNEYPIRIEVEDQLTLDNTARFFRMGAQIFALAPSDFTPDTTLADFTAAVHERMHLV